jgi:hypothetical protein
MTRPVGQGGSGRVISSQQLSTTPSCEFEPGADSRQKRGKEEALSFAGLVF